MEDVANESCFEAIVDVLMATNWYAVGGATVATFFMNFLLYSFVWGELWFQSAMPDRYKRFKRGGVSKQIVEQEMGANMGKAFLFGLLTTAIFAFALFHLQYALGVSSVEEASQLALFVSFFLLAPQYVGQVIWESPSWTLISISVVDQILSTVVSSAIVFHLSSSA